VVDVRCESFAYARLDLNWLTVVMVSRFAESGKKKDMQGIWHNVRGDLEPRKTHLISIYLLVLNKKLVIYMLEFVGY